MEIFPEKIVVVGYLFSEKKERSLRKLNYLNDNLENGVIYKRITNVDEMILNNKNIPCDILLHKSSEDMSPLSKSSTRIEDLLKIKESFPFIKIVDDVDKIQSLFSRKYMNELMEKVCEDEKFVNLSTPRYYYVEDEDDIVTSFEKSGLKFPLICKSIVSAGHSESHIMTVVFNKKGLEELKPPLLLQEFINHNAIIYKVFVLGEEFHVISRCSLENIDMTKMEGFANVVFDSQEPFPSFSHAGTFVNSKPSSPSGSHDLPLSDKLSILQKFTPAISKISGLTLFGYDIIFNDEKNILYVVDVNYFPSFKGYPNFNEKLRKYLRRLAV